MATTLSKILTGSALGTASLFVFVLNVTVLFVLVRGGFLGKKYNCVYILTFMNIMGDSVKMFVITAYLSPASVVQSWLFPEGELSPWNVVLGVVFIGTWYQAVIIEIIMALDRLVLVVFSQWSFLFSRRNVITMVCLLYPITTAMSIVANVVFPCCPIFLDHKTFGYAYFGNTTNYSNNLFDVPMNFSSSAIALSCYVVIFVYVKKVNRSMANTVDSKTRERRRRKEVRYAFQFGLLSIFTLIVWVSLRVFPLFIPPSVPELYSITTFCDVAHCSANSVVYVTMNLEFQVQFVKQFKSYFASLRGMPTVTTVTSIRGNRTSSSAAIYSHA